MTLRFVVHRHETVFAHNDLMFERDGVLETYRLALNDLDRLRGGQAVPAERIADHRREYLDYQGPVSGDRGRVVMMDQGTFTIMDQEEGLRRYLLASGTLCGALVITVQNGSSCRMQLIPAPTAPAEEKND